MEAIELAGIQDKICLEIPILKAMQMQIREIQNNQSLLYFPLQPNHNHKGTAFGGSLYSASTAACYALLYGLQTQAKVLNRDLVIAKGEMKYLKPVAQNFYATAVIPQMNLIKLMESFSVNKPHRITLNSSIREAPAGASLCDFVGEFAFVRSS